MSYYEKLDRLQLYNLGSELRHDDSFEERPVQEQVPDHSESLSIKIHIPMMSTITTMEFHASQLVYDVILQIKASEKELSCIETTKHFGLFIGAEEFKFGRWLQQKKTLKDCAISSGMLLEFKSAVRDQKMKLMDGRVNVFPINESFPVSVLIKSFCKCIGVKNAEDYALCIDIEDDKITSLDSKFNTFWLNDSQNLREQNIDTQKVVAFRRRFYNDNRNVAKDDRMALNKVFGEISEAVITGRLPVVQSEATTCAAVIAQITLGDMGLIGKVDFKQFLPKDFQQSKVEKEVIDRYKRLQGLTEMMAKYRFFIEAKGLKHYGFKFFKVFEKMENGKWNKTKPVFLGINPDVVVRVTGATKEVISRWPLSKVVRFAASASDISLDFGDWAQKMYNCYTKEATDIASLISSYYKNVQKCRYAFEDLRDHTELFTIPLDVEQLEPERSLAPTALLGPKAALSSEQPARRRAMVEGQEEVEEIFSMLLSQMMKVDVARVSSDEVNLPPDIEMSKMEVMTIAEVVALTVGEICHFLATDEPILNYSGMKPLAMTLAMQVPGLLHQLKVLAKNDLVKGQKESRFLPRVMTVAESMRPFLNAIMKDDKEKFIATRKHAKSIIEACHTCRQEVDSSSASTTSNIMYKMTVQHASKEMNGGVLQFLTQTKLLCAQCPSGPQQEDINARASFLVDLSAQHFLLLPALATFNHCEIKELLVSMNDALSEAMNHVAMGCAEYLIQTVLPQLAVAQEKVDKALSWCTDLIRGGPSAANPVRILSRHILQMCADLMHDESLAAAQVKLLLEHLESLIETLNEEEDDENPIFRDIVGELEVFVPKVESCANDLISASVDDILKKAFLHQLGLIQRIMSNILRVV